MDLDFTERANWGAPFYELHVELGPHPAALRHFVPAWETLWSHPTLDGAYADDSRPPSEQEKVDLADWVSDEAGHMFGMATLPDGNRAPCGCVGHIPDFAYLLSLPQGLHDSMNISYGPDPLEPGDDAFTFYVPFPALDRLYGWESSDDVPDGLARSLDAWLAAIAASIYEVVPFAFAAAGPEGSYDADRIREGDIDSGPGALVLRPDIPGGELRRYLPTY
jgi:hypothetical protein